jgi:hypothetical protein
MSDLLKSKIVLMFVVSIICISGLALPANADSLIEQRIDDGLQDLIDNPWPYPGDGWEARYAGLLIYTNQQQTLANQLIGDWCASYPLDKDAAPTPYNDKRPDSVLFTLYLKSQCSDQLTAQSKDAIEDVVWRWVYRHSFIDPGQTWPLNNPTKSVWYISGSENHCADQRIADFLSLQILRQAGAPYGPDAVLYDGYTVEQHYQAWIVWYKEFFRQRAQKGLTCEIAHPSSYGLSTISSYYDIADLTEDVVLKEVAENFLTLFWANVACEFEPRTGIRGSIASSRNYKWSWSQNGDLYWARYLLYAYDWCDLEASSNLTHLNFYMSDYRPPEILRSIASDTNRGSYMGTSRRFGRGSGWDAGIYDVLFDDGAAENSYMRRDVYYTPAYTMSALSFDSGRDYIELVRQSRTMGVTFSNDINDRIVVYGGITPVAKATEYKMETSAATNGVLGENCLIVARDPQAVSAKSNSTRIFITDGDLWNNRLENDNGWFFTQAGNGYCAFRVAGDGGYTVDASPYNNGYILTFNDMWAPVVVQMGKAGDYMESFSQFKDAVKANSFAYSSGKLTYTSLAGDTYEYWSNSTTVGKINGSTVDLNPAKTYDFPNLSMLYGSDVATVSYPGYDDLILNFSCAYDETVARTVGDTNYDCKVNLADFAAMAKNWMIDVSLSL